MSKKRRIITCECGMRFSLAQRTRHESGVWHKRLPEALELRDRGLTFAEIARQLSVTRAYISRRFKEMEVAA